VALEFGRGGASDPHAAQPALELLEQPRLAEPGLAVDLEQDHAPVECSLD
jgi:hypothetical protein